MGMTNGDEDLGKKSRKQTITKQTITYDCESFFRLPQTILVTIFSKYLHEKDIVSLDTAMSDKKFRQILLTMFASVEFVIEGHPYIDYIMGQPIH